MLARHRTRRPHLQPPSALARQRDVLRQHVQVPQRHRRRQALLTLELDGRGELQVAEIGDQLLRPRSDADQFDFRHDEAVAARVLAHASMQMGQRGQVENLTLAHFVPHARVPPVERLDQPDDAPAAVPGQRALHVVLVVGDEVRPVFRALRPHADVVELPLAGFERRVDFRGIEIAVNERQFGFGVRMESRMRDVRHRKPPGADVDAEELVKVRDRFDRFQVKAFPLFQVANVPPRVHLLPAAEDHVGLMRNKVYRRVRPGEVIG